MLNDYTLAVQIHDVNFLTKEVVPNSGEVLYGNTAWDIVDGMTVHNPFSSAKTKRMYCKQTLKGIEIPADDLPYDEKEVCEVFINRLLDAGYASYVVREGEIVPPWTWDKKTHQPVLKIRKKKVVRNKSEKYTESNRRNISKSHEARRADPVRAREIATKASMAAKAKVSSEERKKICAKARAVLLLKRESMTPKEREEAHRRRVDAAKRSHETRRRNAALKAAEAEKNSEYVNGKEE